jgi:ABC-2 type transport system permease protein
MTVITGAPAISRRRSPLAQLTRVEFKLFLRERVGPIWGIGLPVLLLVIFGAIPAFKKVQTGYSGLTILDAYVPILITMSLALLALIAMPTALVNYRERGVLRRLRTTPAGPVRVLSAQLIVNVTVAVATLVVLLVVSRFAYGVPLPRDFGAWVVVALFAMAALFALGLFVASVGTTTRAAAAIGAILFYPLMFFSGLWLPIPSMPVTLQHVSHATPLGAAWEAMSTAATGSWPHALPLLTMAAYAVVFGAVAAKLFRWE